MKRDRKKDKNEYINVRIKQLDEDAQKASDPHDRVWYYRLISELKMVQRYE